MGARRTTAEWIGLSLLHRLVPGLAPEPLRQRTDDGVPVNVISRVAGEPLGSAPGRGRVSLGGDDRLATTDTAQPSSLHQPLHRAPGHLVTLAARWCHTLPPPYRTRLIFGSPWTRTISTSNASSLTDRADGNRFLAA